MQKPHPKQAQKYPDADLTGPDDSRICLLEPSMQWAWGSPGPTCPPAFISPPQTHWYLMIPLTKAVTWVPHYQPWTTLGPYMAVSIFVLMANSSSLTSSEMD